MAIYASGMIYLGNMVDMDPQEGPFSSNASLAASTLGGHTYGSASAPLFAGSTLVQMNDTDGNGRIPLNDYGTSETISYTINDVPTTALVDTAFIVHNVQITRALGNGQTDTVTSSVRIVQDTSGNVFLMPPPQAEALPGELAAVTTYPIGIVAEVVFETSFPLSPIALGDAFALSLAEDVEAVHEGDADVDFGGLAVWVS